jgi:hypothetical protein
VTSFHCFIRIRSLFISGRTMSDPNAPAAAPAAKRQPPKLPEKKPSLASLESPKSAEGDAPKPPPLPEKAAWQQDDQDTGEGVENEGKDGPKGAVPSANESKTPISPVIESRKQKNAGIGLPIIEEPGRTGVLSDFADDDTTPRFEVSIPFVEVEESSDSTGGKEKSRSGQKPTNRLRRMASVFGVEDRPEGLFHLRVVDHLKNAQWMASVRRRDFKQLAEALAPTLEEGAARLPIPDMFHKRLLAGKTSLELERSNLEVFLKRVNLLPFSRIPNDLVDADFDSSGGKKRVQQAKVDADNWVADGTPGKQFLAFLMSNENCRVDRGEFQKEQREKYEAETQRLARRSRNSKLVESDWVAGQVKAWVGEVVAASSSEPSPAEKAADSQKVLEELLATEKSYLQKLLWVINAYLRPLSESARGDNPVIAQEDVVALFG